MVYLAVGMMFLAVSLVVYVLGGLYVQRPTRDQLRATARLRELNRPEGTDPVEPADDRRGFQHAVANFGSWVARGNEGRFAGVQHQLSLAGYRAPGAVRHYLGLQLLLVVTFGVSAGAAAVLLGRGWQAASFAFAGGAAVGLLAPSLLLASQVRTRQRQIRAALPDALDVLVLCVEGGTTMNAGLTWVADEIAPVHPVLGGELQTLQHEIQLGLTPGEAFQSLADRCGLPEVRDLAAVLRQSERYGASVAKAVRGYVETARQDRQVWAEEVAQKAAVKILFPMLLCIFPAMFIVLLGPAALQMSQHLTK